MFSCALTLQCFASNSSVWGGSPHEFLTRITCFLLFSLIWQIFEFQCSVPLKLRSNNARTDVQKSLLQAAIEHISLAEQERARYNAICATCRSSVHTVFSTGIPPAFSKCPPSSVSADVHYSFDMAQQAHYPANPLQPGPIYFLTLRKCTVFGVCCEAIP